MATSVLWSACGLWVDRVHRRWEHISDIGVPLSRNPWNLLAVGARFQQLDYLLGGWITGDGGGQGLAQVFLAYSFLQVTDKVGLSEA